MAKRVRIAILLCILFGVVLYAIKDVRSRRERNTWERTLDVAVVIIHVDGSAPVDRAAVDALGGRMDAMAARLGGEMGRWRSGGPSPAFRFHVKGPVDVATHPPSPASDGFGDLAKQAWEVSRWCAGVDERGGVDTRLYDTRIYVAARKPADADRTVVEGKSEENGRLGFVDVELDGTMTDLTAIVVAHELFHTLGASDKYDSAGHASFPDGYADPKAVPLIPQKHTEIMARNRPIGPGREEVPETIDDIAVGEATAREIGWVK